MARLADKFTQPLDRLLKENKTPWIDAEGAVSVFRIDRIQRLVSFIFYDDAPSENVCFFQDDLLLPQLFGRAFRHTDPTGRNVRVRILWVSFAGAGVLQAKLGDKALMIRFRGGSSPGLSPCDLLASPSDGRRGPVQWLLALAARFPLVKKRYQDSWLLVDKDTMADDNAEHFCRWLLREHPEQKVFFALDRRSPDWPRLFAEGFPLIDLKGIRYFFAFVHCSWLISSNVTGYVVKPGWRKTYASLITHRFCTLEHGVGKDYMPRNEIPLDMQTAAALPEYEGLTRDENYAHVVCAKEVRLTGFARHDELLRRARSITVPSKVLLAPTWREYLAGKKAVGGSSRAYSPTFRESGFFRAWQSLLSAEGFLQAAFGRGYTVHFFCHPYMKAQLADFSLGDVAAVSAEDGSLQDILADTALLITDYSSLAFEQAIVGRAVLYFQFDRELFSGGAHSYAKGYFDYDRHGFGEVAETLPELVSLAQAYFENGCLVPERYRRRADSFFAFRDTDNCLRIYEALEAMTPKRNDFR